MRNIQSKIKKYCKYKLECNLKGLPLLSGLIRIYYNIQRDKKIGDTNRDKCLQIIYNEIEKRNKSDVRDAARKELAKDYTDNIYSLFCSYIILRGEV